MRLQFFFLAFGITWQLFCKLKLYSFGNDSSLRHRQTLWKEKPKRFQLVRDKSHEHDPIYQLRLFYLSDRLISIWFYFDKIVLFLTWFAEKLLAICRDLMFWKTKQSSEKAKLNLRSLWSRSTNERTNFLLYTRLYSALCKIVCSLFYLVNCLLFQHFHSDVAFLFVKLFAKFWFYFKFFVFRKNRFVQLCGTLWCTMFKRNTNYEYTTIV